MSRVSLRRPRAGLISDSPHDSGYAHEHIVYYADIPVGAICCRFENLASTSNEKPPTLAVLTLAYVLLPQPHKRPLSLTPCSVLAPYRSQSLGTALLTAALRSCIHPTPPPPPIPSSDKPNARKQLVVSPPRKVVNRAMAHVQVGNDDAKRFYGRLGFKETEV